MSLELYFQSLRLSTGACELTLVQDHAVGRSLPSKEDNTQEDLKNTLRTSATKFTMDECDEPLYCPSRRLSSNNLSDEEEFGSIDSLEALNDYFSSESLSMIDDSYRSIDGSCRSCGSDFVVSSKTAEKRWSNPKSHDFPIHCSSVCTGLKVPCRRTA